ncbi:MAG: hypothetical protein AB1656_06490 [Candidatus Omnitrophota bacterium]
MISKFWKSRILAAALCLIVMPAFSQGIFDKKADWGDTNSPPKRGTYKVAGSVTVTGGVYDMKGNGDDVWDSNDEGFFVYTEKTGSWSLSGKVKWVDSGGANDWCKVGVMVREQGAVAGSRHYWVELRGGAGAVGDRTDAQWRATANAGSSNAEVRTPDNQAVNDKGDGLWLRVSRIATVGAVMSEFSYDGTNWVFGHAQKMTFPDPVALGLVITNHVDNELLANATVSDVKLVDAVPAVGFRSVSLTDPVYVANDPITVTLEIGGSGAVKVEETPPAGWAITNISDGGTATGGVITWNLTAAKKVTYVATAPAGSTADAVFSGKIGTAPIQGTNKLSAPKPIEIFDNHLDVGAVGAAGAAEYQAADKRYVVTGSGADIWDTADEFHFVYKKLSGAFSLETTVFGYNDTGANDWSKFGLMVRDNLTANSSHVMAIIRGADLQYDTQWRASAGSASGDTGLKADESGEMKIVKTGSTVEAYYMGSDGNWVRDSAQTIQLSDPVYAGLVVTSHDDGLFAIGEFENVKLTLYPFQVAKVSSSQKVQQGGTADVTLTVEVREGEKSNVAIKETYSPAASISNIKASAGQATDDKKGTISWNLTGATGNVTLKYILNVPSDYKDPFVNISGTFDNGQGFAGTTGSLALAVEVVDLGIFQGHMDIGAPGAPGNVKIDGDAYQVIGSGHDIWDAADDFHYLYFKTQGDFKMSIDDPYIGAYGSVPSTNTWMKMGIMARQDLTAGSAYCYGSIRSSDQAMMIQWRDGQGAGANWDSVTVTPDQWQPGWDASWTGISNPTLDQIKPSGTLIFERSGNEFIVSYLYQNEEYYVTSHEYAMTDPIYLGIAVTSHQTGATSQGTFKNPKLISGVVVAVEDWMLH